MALSEFEAMSTLIGGPDMHQRISQRENAMAFERLPRNRKGYPTDDETEAQSRALAERLGFVFGEVIDDLFVKVTPPKGWYLQADKHFLYTSIHDDQGRKRGSQFYKAAAYDRDAFYHFGLRYHVHETKPQDWFERSHPPRPEALFRMEKRRVLVDDRGEVIDTLAKGARLTRAEKSDVFVLGSDGFSRWERGPRIEHREVKVYLPDEEQPPPIVPRGYDVSFDVIDDVTGEVIWKGETFYHPTRDEDPRWAFRSEEIETAGRQAAVAWLDANFPDWRDPAAYWNA